jgi:hypothetical protein
MSVVEIAYNPNDFYYVSSGIYNDISNTCPGFLNDIEQWNTKCCISNPDKSASSCPTWNDNITNCFNFEVCKNKDYADKINSLENNNGGSDERQSNLQKQYPNEALKAINISASILIITYMSVYFFKT